MNRNLRKGLNGWRHTIELRALRYAQLYRAALTFRNRNARKAMNQLLAKRAERLAALARLEKSARTLINRGLRKGWNKLAAGARLLQLARRAGAAFSLRHRRKGFNGWQLYLSGDKGGMRGKMEVMLKALKYRYAADASQRAFPASHRPLCSLARARALSSPGSLALLPRRDGALAAPRALQEATRGDQQLD